MNEGDPLLWIEHNDRGVETAEKLVKEAFSFSEQKVDALPLIYERMTHRQCQAYTPLI